MKILAVRVDWMSGWANDPHWEVLVDELPGPFYCQSGQDTPPLWEERNNLYRAQIDNAIEYKYYQKPGEGYGGSVFTMKMKDGTMRDLRGPWSSRIACINAAFPDRDLGVDVNITVERSAYDRGYTFYGGMAITLTSLLDYLEEHKWIVDNRVGDEDTIRSPRKIVRDRIRLGQVARSYDMDESLILPLDIFGNPKGKQSVVIKEITR